MGPGVFVFAASLLGGYLEGDEKAQGIVVKGVWSILHNRGQRGCGIDWKMAGDESD
jgi:hypothetical protein